MDCVFLVVSPITYALKGKAELESHGIACKVEKIKNVASLGGCGFGIKVSKNVSQAAMRFLKISGINTLETLDCEVIKR